VTRISLELQQLGRATRTAAVLACPNKEVFIALNATRDGTQHIASKKFRALLGDLFGAEIVTWESILVLVTNYLIASGRTLSGSND